MPPATAAELDVMIPRLKALSDPNRLRIIDRLRSGSRCVCDLTDALDERQSLLSFHLKTLKDAGLVTDQREGRWAYYALDTLAHFGVPWTGHPPRGLEGLEREPWDFVITVCDRAKESCPVFPGRPVQAHWGMRDPADVEGSEAMKRAAFRDAFVLLRRRIELLLALPIERLERMALESRVRAIGSERAPPR